ncbi:uncharacterized protein EV420DRAFT_1567510 [Desarmillaria tabescens]|uniref:Uncharacterized protein n=1 Tax=Armillaria tabescens TaxID=1929756 RepID=A0AA39JSX8_ARMTA|nr:uncharacterized protein EV420DRAFT_1567510 [Desarmillaria tabescens]KAK0448345.1 hypothetical protein EV420DRAFT_1567510 [Desarmillaria tabescens]
MCCHCRHALLELALFGFRRCRSVFEGMNAFAMPNLWTMANKREVLKLVLRSDCSVSGLLAYCSWSSLDCRRFIATFMSLGLRDSRSVNSRKYAS